MDRRILRNKKSKTRNAKPYDRPNQSILGRVASKFKGILNPSWIFNVSQWMGAPEEEADPHDEESGEDDEEEEVVQSSAHGSKRPRLGLDQPPPSILSEGTQTWLDTPTSSLFNPSSRLTSAVTQNSLLENKADQVIINGDDHSENSEGSASTSGCSSLVSSHKERSNCLPVPNRRLVQSPFESIRNELSRRDVTSRKEGLSADMSASRMSLWSGTSGFSPAAKLQRRSPSVAHSNQPGFNVGAFVGSSKSSQQPDRKVASPFYQGKTSFGGASSTRRMPVSAAPYQVDRPSRNQIKVRPKESEDSLEGMSSAAKRILKTLEKMSSPVTDAKKIPNTNRSPVDLSLYMMPPRLRSNVVSTPTITKGPPIANISTISKLTTLKSCMNRFHNSSMESFSSPKETRNTPVCETPQQDTTPQPLSTNKGPGKMRCKLTKQHQPSARNEEFEYSPLPSIPLPISTLPSFKQINPLATIDSKSSKPTNDTPKSRIEFEFSPPIEIQPTLPPILPSNLPTSKSDRSSPVEKLPFTFSNPTELETPLPTPGLFTTNLTSTSWSCSCCWVQNPAKETKCLACDTPRNNSSTASSSTPSTFSGGQTNKPAPASNAFQFGSQSTNKTSTTPAFGVPSGGFSFGTKSDTPDQKNPATSQSSGFGVPSTQQKTTFGGATISPFGKTDKPGTVALTSSKPDRSSSVEKQGFTFSNPTELDTPSPAPSLFTANLTSTSWSCSCCWVQNPAKESKCLACETPRNNSSKKESETPSSAPTSWSCETPRNNSSKKESEMPSPAPSLFTTNLTSSSWSCSCCWVQNPAKETKCLACEIPRNNSKNSNFSIPASTENKLSSFASSKEGNTTATPELKSLVSVAPFSAAPTTSNFVFGDVTVTTTQSSAPSGGSSFKMPTSIEDKLLSFATAKEDNSTAIPEGKSAVSAASFSAVPAASNFVFGNVAATTTQSSAPSSGFSFPMPTSTENKLLSFASAKEEPSTATLDAKPAVSMASFSAAPTTSTFSFGNVAVTTTQSSAPSGGFSFAMPTSTENKLLSFASAKEESSTVILDAKPAVSMAPFSVAPTTSTFSFGNVAATTTQSSTPSSGFSFPMPTSTENKLLSFASAKEEPSTATLDVKAAVSLAAFSAAPTASTFGFGNVAATTTQSSAPTGGFSFAMPTSTENKLLSFASAKEENPTVTPDVKPAVSVAPFNAAPTTSSFAFGNVAATTTQSSAPSGGFSFFAATTAATPSLFTFGASSNASQPAKTSGFPATTTTTSVFGASIPASTSAFVFGAVKTEPVNSTSSNFAFGSGSAPATTPSTFSGFQTNQPAPAPNVFQFGSQPTNNTSAAPAFGAASGGFSFGAKSETPNQMAPATSQAPGFGVPSMQQQQQPMFGGVTAPTFGKTDKPAGFNFGAAAPASTPFMFGSMDKKQAPNQFAFGNAQDSQNVAQFPPAPQFSISTPANFNFGATSTQSGPFQFAAASTPEQSTGPRKIRKAVRRVRN